MYKVGIITSSDKGSQGLREDKGGPKIREILEQFADDFTTAEYTILPDEKDQLAAEMIRMADDLGMDLIITTGGTGFSKRDVTPEATLSVITRRTPGIPEAMRSISLAITMRAMLSRAEAGIRNDSLIINLPGSPKAIEEVLGPILPSLKHGLDILQGRDAECARH
ncbi:MAG: MogA/MoaB family molybdenum cofactor biosynthesis protein [Firmicutes bacterium]|nr:MogA/MoaB family molybdenum cofactor biosynthesis protein [Bacillota bacterium]